MLKQKTTFTLEQAFAEILNDGRLCDLIGLSKSNRSQAITRFNEKKTTRDTMEMWVRKAGYQIAQQELWKKPTKNAYQWLLSED